MRDEAERDQVPTEHDAAVEGEQDRGNSRQACGYGPGRIASIRGNPCHARDQQHRDDREPHPDHRLHGEVQADRARVEVHQQLVQGLCMMVHLRMIQMRTPGEQVSEAQAMLHAIEQDQI